MRRILILKSLDSAESVNVDTARKNRVEESDVKYNWCAVSNNGQHLVGDGSDDKILKLRELEPDEVDEDKTSREHSDDSLNTR